MCRPHTKKRKQRKSKKEEKEEERRLYFTATLQKKISWAGGGLLTLSAGLYLQGPAWYQQTPWLQIGLVEAVRYSKRTNTDQNQTHIKMSLSTATLDPSP